MKIVILLFVFCLQIFGNIPEKNRPNWSNAGLLEEPPSVVKHSIDISQFSGSDYEKIDQAITRALTLTGWVVVYIPEGQYTIDQPIYIGDNYRDNARCTGLIFRGDGPGKTVISFDMAANKHMFEINGYLHNNKFLKESKERKTFPRNISLRDPLFVPKDLYPGLNNGDWVYMYEVFATDYNNDIGTTKYIGQFLQIKKGSNANFYTTKETANKEYRNVVQEYHYGRVFNGSYYEYAIDDFLEYKHGVVTLEDPEEIDEIGFQKFEPIKNIGFENFKVERLQNGKSVEGKLFKIQRAMNCWLDGIESYNASHAHVSISWSTHITVRNSYFHDAFNYDHTTPSDFDDEKCKCFTNIWGEEYTDYKTEGTGYGIFIDKGSTNCLLENNKFKKYRHAILTTRGANDNVIAYNFMSDPGGDWWHLTAWPNMVPGCIRLHGEYSFGNLFEANSVEQIHADGAIHGINGPYNTFYRNMTRVWNNDLKLFSLVKANTSENLFRGNGEIETNIDITEGDIGFDGSYTEYKTETFKSYYYNYKGDFSNVLATPSFIKNYTNTNDGTAYNFPPESCREQIAATVLDERSNYNKIHKFRYTSYIKNVKSFYVSGSQINLKSGFIVKKGDDFSAKIDESLSY